ncbi:MAG: hypothetical protein LBJ00_02250 [Planctomycetaceae bacterium]|jgi:hypothetical protein|nr:hypothetical protein [Planctomycetaceae bacterium]
MTHELILTSVANGLESEGGGFCVVAADSCFPESLIENLFQLSDYRYHTRPDADDVHLNPVIYSHTIISPQNASPQSSITYPSASLQNNKKENITTQNNWHVLSRIAPAGQDYQGKQNQLAHHIVLSEDELVVEGPAWLLALAGFHLTQWYTPPINFPIGRPVPTISLFGIPPQTCRQKIARERLRLDLRKMSVKTDDQLTPEMLRQLIQAEENQITTTDMPTSPCPAWKELTGDAGWGGVLAEAVRNKKNTAVIYPQGTNILPLFVESLAIVPAQFIWDTTFTTCYFDPNNNVDADKPNVNKSFRKSPTQKTNPPMLNSPYQLTGVIAGSREAEELLSQNDILIIDLTRRAVEPPEGIFVKFAITGEENHLPVETHYPTESAMNESKNKTEQNNLNQSQNDTNPTNESAAETENNKISDSPDNGNLKFEPNTNPANLSITPQPPNMPVPQLDTKQSYAAQNKNKLLNNLTFSLSRNQFYLSYLIALIIIVGLLLLVVDQISGLGTLRFLFGQKNTPQVIVDPEQAIVVQNPESPAKNADTEQKTAEQIKAEQQTKLKQAIAEFDKKRKKSADELEKFINTFRCPKYLQLIPPSIKGNVIIVPKNSHFDQLADLHQFGAGLRLEWISLWDFEGKRIETRRLQFNIGDPKDQDNNPDQKTEQNNAPENTQTKNLRYRAVNLNGAEVKIEADNVIALPDPNRFEWEVVAIIQNKTQKNKQDDKQENKTENNDKKDNDNNSVIDDNKTTEVKLFHVRLEADGLYIRWERSGLLPENFYDTLRVSLGFLRFSVEQFAGDGNEILLDDNSPIVDANAKENQNTHTTQLFKPTLVSPVSPAIGFGEGGQLTVAMPFAESPWSLLFNNADQFDYKLELDAKSQPELIADVETRIKKAEQSNIVELEFTTQKVEALRVNRDEAAVSTDTYFPLQTKFTAETNTNAVLWNDTYQNEVKELRGRLAAIDGEVKAAENEVDQIKQKMMRIGNDPKRIEERKELEEKQSKLSQKKHELADEKLEINSKINKLPESHDVIVKNNEINFEYSVHLTSGKNERKLLIMTTSKNLIEGNK